MERHVRNAELLNHLAPQFIPGPLRHTTYKLEGFCWFWVFFKRVCVRLFFFFFLKILSSFLKQTS